MQVVVRKTDPVMMLLAAFTSVLIATDLSILDAQISSH